MEIANKMNGYVGTFAADREVQRILLELLNQMDGFDQTVNVKVITKAPHEIKYLEEI